jgi:hypothetical protein
MSRLNFGNPSCSSVHNLLSSHLLYNNVKIIFEDYNFACGSV